MAELAYTPFDDIPKIHARARRAFLDGKLKSIEYRKEQIAQVGYMLKDNEQRFFDALKHDLGRPTLETEFLDFSATYQDIHDAYNSVEKWATPYKADFNLSFWAMTPKIRPEPKGLILIIAPFNGPVIMLISPLVGAIAAGNAVILKPSEQASRTAALFAEIVPQYLDNDLYHVVNGGVPETTRILELQFDHILYTGNQRVARIVAAAAAKHLTPLTLELGGKNPVIVDPKSDLKLAARRVLWGRMINAGQVCVCPEYVLITPDIQDAFIEALKEVHNSFYPEGPKNSESFARIVAVNHAQRIKDLLDNTKGTIVFGGDTDVENRYIAPTLVKDVTGDDPEIFGPVLLLVPVKNVDEAIAFMNARDHPLAVYVFSQDKAFQEKIFSNTQSGAAVANDTMIHLGVPGLPMGGVGQSGYGYYTGKDMFEQFTHKRTSIDNPSWVDKVGFGCRYPPYKSLKPLQALMPSLPPRPKKRPGKAAANGSSRRWALWLSALLAGVVALVLTRKDTLKLK
ncbi:NAD-dependent aldehyde dehydrogenase [Fomes fomentarius]|nr:NAD-dependent aldehyde dehydrogenase [Fomes fomentarius]